MAFITILFNLAAAMVGTKNAPLLSGLFNKKYELEMEEEFT